MIPNMSVARKDLISKKIIVSFCMGAPLITGIRLATKDLHSKIKMQNALIFSGLDERVDALRPGVRGRFATLAVPPRPFAPEPTLPIIFLLCGGVRPKRFSSQVKVVTHA
ncbi:hypothetical protein SDC9_187709 [bioreactor metagenome]|uniref:Uncharacterized protein n=1 Tax=bioreactor metagenome TaxID=1076179 RepID=A0A645HXY4_9ZZZZ